MLGLFLLLAPLLSSCNAPTVQADTPASEPPAPAVSYATTTPTHTPSQPPTITPTPTDTPILPSDTPSPTATRTPYPTKDPAATATAVPTFAPASGEFAPHFWFIRPIPAGYQDYVDPNYRYATTQNGAYRPHHGVDIPNPEGTPVVAIGAGEVIFAGPDWDVTFGPNPFFYGNLVAILHDETYNGQPVYTLYGHLSQVTVAAGQRIGPGEIIGLVGGTGVALGGPHLHLEVRVGYNDYTSTRNPELWLRPYPRWGTLAGRVTDENGNLVPIANITIRSTALDDPDDGPVSRYTVTYATGGTNPDDIYGENFVVMDLPPGQYQVTVNNGTRTQNATVTIRPDSLSFIEFRDVAPPATWTPTPTGTRTTATPTTP